MDYFYSAPFFSKEKKRTRQTFFRLLEKTHTKTKEKKNTRHVKMPTDGVIAKLFFECSIVY